MEETTQAPTQKGASLKWLLNDLSTKLILLLVFITPIFVIPNTIFPFQFTKTGIAIVLIFALLGLGVWRAVHEKKATFFYSPLLYSLYALPLAYLIVSIFSTQPLRSFFGYQLETDTFMFILFGAVTASTLLSFLSKKTQVFSTLVALLVASWVVLLFQLVQVLFNAPLPFTVLNNPIVNLVGRWNDFGVFVGLVAALTLFSLESLPLPKKGKYLMSGTFVVALLFLALVNLTEVWVLFGLAALSTLVLSFAKRRAEIADTKKFTLATSLAAIGVLVSVFFLFFGGGVSTQIQTIFNINALEVRPSVQGTLDVLSGVYAKSPVVGAGPNTFTTSWLLYRPEGVLQTPFWNTNFGAGSGTIPTAFVNGGIILSFAWIAFSLLLLYTIFRALFFSNIEGGRSYVLTALTAFGSLYLLLVHYLYAPSQVLTVMLFVFVGLFLASLRGSSFVKTFEINGLMSPRVDLGITLIGVALGLVMLGVLYDTGKNYVAIVSQEKAIQYANQGNYEKAEAAINSAIGIEIQDRFYRTAALIQIAKLNQVVREGSGVEGNQARFQNALTGAIQYSGLAIQTNPDRFDNWFTRALVYATVVPLGIQGAYENALVTLDEARVRNPQNPEIDLRTAEVHRAHGETELAREAIAAALTKKADYTAAILLRAQLELAAGDLGDAIESVRNAVFFEPQNPTLLYQLGILFLQDENYTDAAAAFELALQNQPDYANAAFFLAQAYSFLDRTDDALNLMKQLAILNPDNQLVLDARDALQQGENPFGARGVESPVEDTIEVE